MNNTPGRAVPGSKLQTHRNSFRTLLAACEVRRVVRDRDDYDTRGRGVGEDEREYV